MEGPRARAWAVFVVLALTVHGIGEWFGVSPLTFVLIMIALIVFTLKWMPDK